MLKQNRTFYKNVNSVQLYNPRSELQKRAVNPMNFALITLSNFLFFCNFSSFFLLPIFVKELGGGESLIGYIMGSFGLTSLFLIPFFSTLADRRGCKVFMVAGAALMAGASLCFIFVKDIGYMIFVLRLLQGAGFAAFFTSATAMVPGTAEKNRVAERLGIFGAFTIFSYAVGPTIAEHIVNHWGGTDALFVYAASFGFTSLALSLMVREEKTLPRREDKKPFVEFFSLLVAKRYRTILFANLAVAVGLGSLLNFFAVFAYRNGFEASGFFLTYAVTVITVRIFFSKLSDTKGRKKTAAPALFAVALSLLLISQTGSDLQAVVFCFLFSAGYGLLYPTLGAMIADRTKTGMATAMGAFNSSFSAGINYAAFPLGIIAENMGFRTMYAVAGLAVFAGFVAFAAFERETE